MKDGDWLVRRYQDLTNLRETVGHIPVYLPCIRYLDGKVVCSLVVGSLRDWSVSLYDIHKN